jgi:N-acetylneuraminic acid mutarotase
MNTITLFIQRSFCVVGLFAILFVAGLNSSRAQGTWAKKADFGGGVRQGAVGFSIGTKGYIGTGFGSGGLEKDFWEYDPATNSWTQKADFGGTRRTGAVGLSIGNKGYIGTGITYGTPHRDFWEYDPSTNSWTPIAKFGGTARWASTGFSVGNKGYIGTGYDINNTVRNDFWEYDPETNTWTQKTDFGGGSRYYSCGFSIDLKGYLGGGQDAYNFTNDFWEYDPSTNFWNQISDFPGSGREGVASFSIDNKGYVGGGDNGGSELWKYNASINSWSQKASFGESSKFLCTGFSINSKGYIGTGLGFYNNNLKDFWEYTPDTSSCSVPTNLSVINITSSSAKLNWDAVAGAEGYAVRYKVTGTNPWTQKFSTGNSKNLNNLSANTNYSWEVKTYCTINPGFSSDWSAKQKFTTGALRVSDEAGQQISFQIYPNPAEDHATIQFTLPQSSDVSIKVYDVSGKEIETLLNENMEQGDHSLLLKTNHFSKGIYEVKMTIDSGTNNQKLVVQ